MSNASGSIVNFTDGECNHLISKISLHLTTLTNLVEKEKFPSHIRDTLVMVNKKILKLITNLHNGYKLEADGITRIASPKEEMQMLVHDIRSPLMGLEFLMNDESSTLSQEQLGTIAKVTENFSYIINDWRKMRDAIT